MTSDQEQIFAREREKRLLELRAGLCDEDKRLFLDMTLRQIAAELQWPEWLMIDMLQAFTNAYQIGREDFYRSVTSKTAQPP